MVPTISSLQPGMLTEVQVEAHAKNGMCVSFMKGMYRGALDEDHLGGHRGVDNGKKKHLDKDTGDPSMWWKNVFRGKHAKVSVLYSIFVTNMLRSSCLIANYCSSCSLLRVYLQLTPPQRLFDFQSITTSLL